VTSFSCAAARRPQQQQTQPHGRRPRAKRRGPRQSQPPRARLPSPPPASPETPGANLEEEKAYRELYEAPSTDADKRIAVGEQFLKKYPESRFRESVYPMLAAAYYDKGDVEKLTTYGEKALRINPDNVDVLPVLATAMARRYDANALDAAKYLDRTEKYARRGIELLNALAKPAGLSDKDFATAKNEKLSMCHSGLGLVLYRRQRFAESAAELERATTIVAKP